MSVDQAWQAIDAQRIGLTDVLEQLSDEEWRQPSLCPGWTVRDVAAHLTLQQVGLGRCLLEVPNLIKARGDLNRLIRDSAHERSVLPTEQIIARIRGMVGSRKQWRAEGHKRRTRSEPMFTRLDFSRCPFLVLTSPGFGLSGFHLDI